MGALFAASSPQSLPTSTPAASVAPNVSDNAPATSPRRQRSRTPVRAASTAPTPTRACMTALATLGPFLQGRTDLDGCELAPTPSSGLPTRAVRYTRMRGKDFCETLPAVPSFCSLHGGFPPQQ